MLVRLLWKNDQLVAVAITYATHNVQNVRISMPSAAFEPAIPTTDPPPIYALDCRTTGIGKECFRHTQTHVYTYINLLSQLHIRTLCPKFFSTTRGAVINAWRTGNSNQGGTAWKCSISVLQLCVWNVWCEWKSRKTVMRIPDSQS
jgi:hypothetical protein